ncbi:MAG: DUF5657 family protein [Patescibacteria group bacterium]
MPPIDNLISFILSVSIWSVAKILVCFAILIYVVFAIVVVRQVSLMTETLNGQLELPLKVISTIHLLGAILVFLLALIIL